MIPRVMTDAIMPTARELNERFGTMGAHLERAAET